MQLRKRLRRRLSRTLCPIPVPVLLPVFLSLLLPVAGPAQADDPQDWLTRLSARVTTPAAEAATVEWLDADGVTHRFHLEAVVEGPRTFLYRLVPLGSQGGEQDEESITVFSDGGQAQREVPGQTFWREVDSPLEPLHQLFGTLADRAFPRLAWVSGVWPPPSAETVEVLEAEEDCPAADCRRLVLEWSASGGRVEYLLALEEDGQEESAVRLLSARLEMDLGQEDFGRTAQELGLPPGPRWGPANRERRLTVRFENPDEDPRASTLAADFAPWQEPAQQTRNQEAQLLARLNGAFYDRIDVHLAQFKIRPVDRLGRVVEGLGPEDFRLRLGRREGSITALDWVPAAGPLADATLEELEELASHGIEPEERLVVLFVHTDFDGHRQMGLWRMVHHLEEFLDRLHPTDRLAVVSFDSHLKLRLDFTRDPQAIVEAARAGVMRRPASAVTPAPEPSLAAVFDPAAAERKGFVETGIRYTAQALAKLPGEKHIFLLSWGLGIEYGGTTSGRYWQMLETLVRNQIPVSSVFVSSGGSTLTGSVARIARHSGGSFSSLYGMGLNRTLNRLGGSLEGHYLLTFEVPAGEPPRLLVIDPVGEGAQQVFRVLYPSLKVGAPKVAR